MLINLKLEIDEGKPLEYSVDDDPKFIDWNNVVLALVEEYLNDVRHAEECEDEKFSMSLNDKLK